MQNTDELSLRPPINFYLPGLEKHLIYIFSSRKSNRYSLFYGLVQTSQGEIGNYFISFFAKCHLQATKKAVNSEIMKKEDCPQLFLSKNQWTFAKRAYTQLYT